MFCLGKFLQVTLNNVQYDDHIQFQTQILQAGNIQRAFASTFAVD